MALGQLHGQEQEQEDAATIDEAAAALGIYIVRQDERPQSEVFHLWPENLPAFELFNDVQTQWHVGPVGPTGLNYPGVRASPAFRKLPASEREAIFEGVCVMERAFLAAISERAAQRGK